MQNVYRLMICVLLISSASLCIFSPIVLCVCSDIQYQVYDHFPLINCWLLCETERFFYPHALLLSSYLLKHWHSHLIGPLDCFDSRAIIVFYVHETLVWRTKLLSWYLWWVLLLCLHLICSQCKHLAFL